MRRLLVVAALGWLVSCGASSTGAVASLPTEPVAAAAPVEEVVVEAPPAPVVAAPPAAPVALAYDLVADVEARKKALRDELGAKTRFETVEGVFLLTAPSGQMGGPAIVAKKALTAYFNGRFARRPARAVSVLLFGEPKGYEAYCRAHFDGACPSPYGFYAHGPRVVVLNAGPGIGTLTHELVHPIVEADFPTAPDWINEGIASLYEAFALPKDGEIRGAKNFRHAGLVAALRSKDLRERASLPALFAMSDPTFRGDHESLNYASARYFCQWMDGQNKLWPFYQAWRDGFEGDPSGRKAFVATMGKTPEELDETWATWVRRL